MKGFSINNVTLLDGIYYVSVSVPRFNPYKGKRPPKIDWCAVKAKLELLEYYDVGNCINNSLILHDNELGEFQFYTDERGAEVKAEQVKQRKEREAERKRQEARFLELRQKQQEERQRREDDERKRIAAIRGRKAQERYKARMAAIAEEEALAAERIRQDAAKKEKEEMQKRKWAEERERGEAEAEQRKMAHPPSRGSRRGSRRGSHRGSFGLERKTPQNAVDYEDRIEIEEIILIPPTQMADRISNLSRAEVRSRLNERKIEHNPRAWTETLRKLLRESEETNGRERKKKD